MQAVINPTPKEDIEILCYHCGTPCVNNSIVSDEKVFCCEGCKLVYDIINEKGLCNYYELQSHPGLGQIKAQRNDKFTYLDDESIALQLFQFTDGDAAIVNFYLPGIHCASCMWLLEHMSRLDAGIKESHVNFSAKEVNIRFSRKQISLRKVVELLATIGYEPYISLDETGKKKVRSFDKSRVIKLGVAGFCFGNIMMMSFPEYLAAKTGIDDQYSYLFRYLNLLLSLPVFFYAASEFFNTAWKGLRQKTLNIDAPIALAVVITFARSIYEILSGTGAGYLDSMSGIVFFMLAGRLVQERTYKFLSFDRNYKSYFPIAVNIVTEKGVTSKKLQDLQEGDVVQVYNDEIIPADSVLLSGSAYIDYSFVTGESEPQRIKEKELLYAGGKQRGEMLTVRVVKPVAGSYLTSLWNHFAFSKNKTEVNNTESNIHLISKYFTVVLLSAAMVTAAYWAWHDPSKIIVSVSAMLIVACPCALLLAATFTNGNIIRILSNNGLFLRDPFIIEQLSKVDHIVFDKTGTITKSSEVSVQQTGHQLTDAEKDLVSSVVRNSQHPNSKALAGYLGQRKVVAINGWEELPGKGLMARCNDINVLVGSAEFTGANVVIDDDAKATTYVRINDHLTAFHFSSVFREDVPSMMNYLRHDYELSLLSGDNNRQRGVMQEVFGGNSELLFGQKPIDKLHYIEHLQQQGKRVMMIGDGLNDAGALQQSNVGITLSDNINNFTPSCDAILDAQKLGELPGILRMAKSSKIIIRVAFAVSIIYNIVGLYFSVQGVMKPVIAAILMPCSTLSIVLISTGMSSLMAIKNRLRP